MRLIARKMRANFKSIWGGILKTGEKQLRESAVRGSG